ncbi:MAG: gas vesicle protein GvpN, partial [Nannocystaceae bacterium]
MAEPSQHSNLSVVEQDPDVLHIEPSDSFVVTAQVESLTNRALTYLKAGLPLHFAGLPGVGKTRLSFHVAALLG